MRIVVVGSGIIGMLTAMECARSGAQVDLVDQAGIPSPWATSNDVHRVVRSLHRGDPALTTAASRAHQAWLDVERRLSARFYHQVGVLTAMAARDISPNMATLGAAGTAARVLPAAELRKRYPQIRFAAGDEAIFEPAAGAVLADKALAALARWLRAHPAVRLHPRRRVIAINEAGAVWLADGAIVSGDRVVVAAGPWSRDLLPADISEDLTLHRQTMLSYLPGPARGAWTGMPAVLGLGSARDAWLMPPVAGTPVRLSAASACREVTAMNGRLTPQRWRDHLSDRFGSLLACFDPAAVTDAADGYYLADTASGGPLLADLGEGAVWAYAACGGMSFKFAPLIARALADRAAGRSPRPTGLDPVDRPRQFAAAPLLGSKRRTP